MTISDEGECSAAPDSIGAEIFEIHPVILGGDPDDPANKVIMTRAEHMQAVRYWNRIVKAARESSGSLS